MTSNATTEAPVVSAPRTPRKRPGTWKGDLLLTLVGVETGIATGLGLTAQGWDVWATPSGAMLALSRITAMSGTALALVSLLLASRIGWLEREVGQDRLVKWHRTLGPYSLYLILAHVLLITLATSAMQDVNAWATFWSITLYTDWMLPALLGFVFMMMIGVTSYKRARSKLKYETWWAIHLYSYLGIALSFMHQIDSGPMFATNQAMTNWWITLYVTVFAIILWARVIVPTYRSLRYDLRVERVIRENHNTVSVILRGRNLDALGTQGGQFFGFRFLAKRYWWESHPYSISAAPHNDRLRVTVKDLGDHSRWMADLQPGTRVQIEGPYGVFTADRATMGRVTLIAGGVGITPVRALLEELPREIDVDLVWRASTEEDLMLRDELEQLAQQRSMRIHYLVGSRQQVNADAPTLKRLVPHIAHTDVFLCGPDGVVTNAVASLKSLGVPQSHIHDEAFAY